MKNLKQIYHIFTKNRGIEPLFLVEGPSPPCSRSFSPKGYENPATEGGDSRVLVEVQEGTLLFSGDNGIPLIRYHIADTRGLIPYQAMLEFLAEWGFDPIRAMDELPRQEGKVRGIHPLPFVYVFGRSNFTVSFFGANIYPENVTVGLEQPGIREWVTGKFVLQVKEDADQNRFLSVVVELAPTIEGSEEKREAIASSIHSQLLRLNSEFANYVPAAYQTPQVELAPSGDPEYFPIGVKHRYTRRSVI